LNDEIVEAQAALETPHFAWDSYRDLIFSYASVVAELDMTAFDRELREVMCRLDAKCRLGRTHTVCDIPTQDLKDLVATYKVLYKDATGLEFPQDPDQQLQSAIEAFCTAENEAAIVQAMAFSNYDSLSGCGAVLLPTSPGPCAEEICGLWLPRSIAFDGPLSRDTARRLTQKASRSWAVLHCVPEGERCLDSLSLEESLPGTYAELCQAMEKLSTHYAGGRDEVWCLEFSIQQGKLWVSFCGPEGECQVYLGDRPCACVIPCTQDRAHCLKKVPACAPAALGPVRRPSKISSQTALEPLPPLKQTSPPGTPSSVISSPPRSESIQSLQLKSKVAWPEQVAASSTQIHRLPSLNVLSRSCLAGKGRLSEKRPRAVSFEA